MTPQQHDDHLRRIARDVRFLAYRHGATHPLAGGLFLLLLLPFLLIVVIGFFFEVGIQLHLIKPAPKAAQPAEERWQPNRHAPKTEVTHK